MLDISSFSIRINFIKSAIQFETMKCKLLALFKQNQNRMIWEVASIK